MPYIDARAAAAIRTRATFYCPRLVYEPTLELFRCMRPTLAALMLPPTNVFGRLCEAGVEVGYVLSCAATSD